MLTSDSIAACFGLLLWGGFEADTTAGLEIGFEEANGGAVAAGISFFTVEDGFVVVVVVAAATFGMLLLVACLLSGSFVVGLIFPLGSSFFSVLPPLREGLTAAFLSSSGSSKFNDRTVDDDRHRSLLVESCSMGFVVTLAPVLLAIVVVVAVELPIATVVLMMAALVDAGGATVAVTAADFWLLIVVVDLGFVCKTRIRS